MGKKIIQVEVSESTYDLIVNLASFVAVVKTALADGWQTTEDLPVTIAAAVKDLVPAVQQGQNVSAEYADDKDASIRAAVLGLEKLVEVFIPKDAPAASV